MKEIEAPCYALGVGLWCYFAFDGPVPGVEASDLPGHVLADAEEAVLNPAAIAAGTKPLNEFFGSDLSDFMDEEEYEAYVASGEDRTLWFDPDEGLATIEALLRHVEGARDLPRPDELLEELRTVRRFLTAAKQHGRRFHYGLGD